jgi:hypothetical protein
VAAINAPAEMRRIVEEAEKLVPKEIEVRVLPPGADATGIGAQFQCAQALIKRLDECHKGGSGGQLGAVLRDALGSAWSAPNY